MPKSPTRKSRSKSPKSKEYKDKEHKKDQKDKEHKDKDKDGCKCKCRGECPCHTYCKAEIDKVKYEMQELLRRVYQLEQQRGIPGIPGQNPGFPYPGAGPHDHGAAAGFIPPPAGQPYPGSMGVHHTHIDNTNKLNTLNF